MKDYSKYIFLLGGYDLEMEEIKNILVQHNIDFHDHNLAWGAKLSSYADVFNTEQTFVGIELIEDCTLPKDYIEIDHHNEKSHLPSSIEQVATLLGIELNRYQQLIAANDKGYIPAMEEIGANAEEIEKIRKADRKAQGVSSQDEVLAEKSILEGKQFDRDVIIITALTPCFSAVTDRLYPFRKLLLLFRDHLVYYGIGAESVASSFVQLIKEKKAFNGGGHDGFFGLAKGVFTDREVKTIQTQIINIVQDL